MTASVIAILDVETTSLDPRDGHVIELAVALWSVEYRSIVRCRSWLCAAPAEEVAKTREIHGIPPALVLACGVPFEVVVDEAFAIVSGGADTCVAWNADFDRSWMPPSLQDAMPWADLCWDVEWPRRSSSRSLLAVAHAHGVQVGALHRATDDVLLVARLLERAAELGVDPASLIARALRPKSLFEVADKRFDEAKNAVYREHRFRFDRPTKSWRRRLPPEDVSLLPFDVQCVEVIDV